MLAQNFTYLFEKHGAPEAAAKLSDQEFAALPPDFPPLIRDFYQEYGRCLLRGGLLQTCHPGDLGGVLALVFGADKEFNHTEFHAFAFSAFGDIYLWNSSFGGGYIELLTGSIFCRGLIKGVKDGALLENNFYTPFSTEDDALDVVDTSDKPLFQQALKKLGALEVGECYGFFPALALGGSPELQYLKRVKAAEHFAIVAQTVEFNLIDVQGYGRSAIVRPVG